MKHYTMVVRGLTTAITLAPTTCISNAPSAQLILFALNVSTDVNTCSSGWVTGGAK
jgi:hypothetical protein